ncbi:MAG: hypothetical protein PVH96_12815 [Gemmatimonadota bacterium]|jgi:hypothetical protein
MRFIKKRVRLEAVLQLALMAPGVLFAQEGSRQPDSAGEYAEVVEEVRIANARFRQIETAIYEGWRSQSPEGCAVSPDGGQAFHFLNPALVDSEVNVLHPELFMYEPRADGSMELVGADYIIPFDQWHSSEPPQLLGHDFARNEPLGVWAIHLWAWRANPNGVFAPWNPEVGCQHAH